MRGWSFASGVLLIALAASAPPVPAQPTEDLGVPPDSILRQVASVPTNYETSYERDISSGTWSQTLSYGLARRRFVLSASGNYSAIDYTARQGLGSGNGGFDGRLSYSATRTWIINVVGHYDKLSSRDLISRATIRRNTLNANMVYFLAPAKQLGLWAILSTEFKQDHTLNLRPLSGQPKSFTVYGASGESVGVDTLFVHDQRDSTFMSGRQDGASFMAEWKPGTWLRATAQATGNRVQPVTKSYLRDFGNDTGGASGEHVDYSRAESPNDFKNYQSRINFTGIPRTLAWLNVGNTNRTEQYFEKQLRGQEHLSLDQRTATFHVEHAPIPGSQITADGKMDRTRNEYALRTNRSSLVTGRTLKSTALYMPTSRTRFGGEFDIEYHRNERQVVQNGLNLSRFLQLNSTHGVSPRLALDAVGTVSLLSFRYEKPGSDRDNLTTYFNVGGGYQVSPRCTTQVHFSRNQLHTIAIDPSASGNNNTQTSYQMNAALQLTANPCLKITQSYVLNAVYQIYDYERAESKNVLNRTRRIDTYAQDSLFSFATIRLVHNFLFRDSGAYTRPNAGRGREYSVSSETYQQNVGLSVFLKPATGIQITFTQSLGNTVTKYLASRSRFVDNRWNLQVGALVDRPIGGGATLAGSVQHIDAYTERVNRSDPLNDLKYWIAGVTLHKEF